MLKWCIKRDAKFGRIMVSTDQLKRGEIILSEMPFACGPKPNCGIVCLGCYEVLQFGEDGYSEDRCTECDWPLCSACSSLFAVSNHASECRVFSNAKVTFAGNVSEDGICTQMDCITPLRLEHYTGAAAINGVAVRANLVLGRYLVAEIAASADQVLIEEIPFALGPKCNGGVVCLGCYKPLKLDGVKDCCKKCLWPLCVDCVQFGAPQHDQKECSVFLQARVRFRQSNIVTCCPQLDCITPLRVLLAKEADPDRWEKELAPMEYHDEARRKLTEIWNADLVNIARYLRGPCKLAERFSEELIMQVVGILEVNAFEARTQHGYPLRCLYPLTAILAHNCVPNTSRSIYPSEGYKIRLRAMKALEAGQQLHHSYTFTLNGTAFRQEHIMAGKFFRCECDRCTDPTELGTHFSTFKCRKCVEGLLLSTNPLDAATTWKCTNCPFSTSNDSINKAVTAMQTEVVKVEANSIGSQRLELSEKLMLKYRSAVHPNHFIMTGLRHNLIEMYGRVKGYEMAKLPLNLLERKEDLCRNLLSVLDKFEPGSSRSRALILYEMHVPLVLLAKNSYIAGALTGMTLKQKLQEPVQKLKECVDILNHEDKVSQEGILGQVAQQALNQLSSSVEGLSDE